MRVHDFLSVGYERFNSGNPRVTYDDVSILYRDAKDTILTYNCKTGDVFFEKKGEKKLLITLGFNNEAVFACVTEDGTIELSSYNYMTEHAHIYLFA